jgi:hypothetical protein
MGFLHHQRAQGRMNIPRPKSGGYVWLRREEIGKQISSISPQNFFYGR